jgi:hypothetical protein
MGLIERSQMIELALERTPTIERRIARRLLANVLRTLGIPRADPIVTVVVHGAELRLRRSHSLPDLIKRHPFYDTALATFVRELHTRTNRAVRIVDVGANIGDTAKIIAKAVGSENVSFICVEADPLNIPFLKENVRGLSVSIVEALAGSKTSRREGRLRERPWDCLCHHGNWREPPGYSP